MSMNCGGGYYTLGDVSQLFSSYEERAQPATETRTLPSVAQPWPTSIHVASYTHMKVQPRSITEEEALANNPVIGALHIGSYLQGQLPWEGSDEALCSAV